jgi:serine O-acetyltransferase
MIKNKQDLKFYLESDCIISGRKNRSARFLFTPVFLDPIGKFMYLLRMVEYYENHQIKFNKIFFLYYYKLRFKRIGLKLGFTIPPNVFGPGLYIPHYGTIVVNQNAKIGKNCVLHTQVCIAGNDFKIIGDNAYISTGVVITGLINLGNDISIASNSLVNKSFNENSILLGGTPAKKLKNRDSWFKLDGKVFANRINKIENLSRTK